MKTKLLRIVLLFCAMTSWSQPGQLDLLFNFNGIGAYGGTPPPATLNPSVQAIVYKSQIYTEGEHLDKIIIVGRFTSFNGIPRQYVARLHPDGQVDTTFEGPEFGGGSNYIYETLILPNGKILVGGVFQSGTYRNFARLHPDGSLDTTFNPSPVALKGADGAVHALLPMDDGRILVGGAFTTYNDVNKRMLRLLEDGTPDPTFNAAQTTNGEVRTIALQGDKILVGGFFSGFASHSKAKIVRLHPDGSYDNTFNVGGNGATGGTAVFDVQVVDNHIFVAGKFTHYNGIAKRGIVRLYEDGQLDPAFNAGNIGVTSWDSTTGAGSGYTIFAICLQPDGKILIGGNFTQYNGTNIPKGLARIYQNGERDLTFVTGAGFTGGTGVYEGRSVVRDVVLQQDGKIVVGGDYTAYDGTARRMLARIITRECSSSAQYTQAEGWADGLLPSSPYTYTLIASGTYTIPSGQHLQACELEILPGAHLVIGANASITVTGKIVNSGAMTIEDSGSLVQLNDEAENYELGSATFLMKRVTRPVKRFDFTYWSSPVEAITLHTVSPATLSDKYFKFNTSASQWQVVNGGLETMERGRGYIIRAPQTFSLSTPSVYTAQFTGKPTNGIVEQPVFSSGENRWNLLGNPYPSAIDATAFTTDPQNASVGGTIYLWTHLTPLSLDVPSGYYVYAASDYATFNQTGYVKPNGFEAIEFDGMIAAGQGFFIEGLAPGNATFNNAMRVTQKNNQFFRSSNEATALQKHRIWLNLTNAQGAFNQTLIGYVEGATNGWDRDFDGRALSGNHVSIYSISGSEKFTIQGRSFPFDVNDVVPLGYRSNLSGTFSIALGQMDGLFGTPSVAVYLQDHVLSLLHNLSEGPYVFETGAGVFDSRFSIVYQTQALAQQEWQRGNLLIAAANSKITVQSGLGQLSGIEVYDVLGRRLYQADGIAQDYHTISSLEPRNAPLLVRITLTDGSQLSRKVLF